MDLSSRTATVAGLDMMGWFLLLALLRWRTCSEAMASTHADTQGLVEGNIADLVNDQQAVTPQRGQCYSKDGLHSFLDNVPPEK